MKQHIGETGVYLVDSNDVGQKWQSLDLCCNEVRIQLLVKKLVLPAKDTWHDLDFTKNTVLKKYLLFYLLGNVFIYVKDIKFTKNATYLAWGDTWSRMVFMMRGTNSDTTLWMFSLYSYRNRQEQPLFQKNWHNLLTFNCK